MISCPFYDYYTTVQDCRKCPIKDMCGNHSDVNSLVMNKITDVIQFMKSLKAKEITPINSMN